MPCKWLSKIYYQAPNIVPITNEVALGSKRFRILQGNRILHNTSFGKNQLTKFRSEASPISVPLVNVNFVFVSKIVSRYQDMIFFFFFLTQMATSPHISSKMHAVK